MQYCKCHEKLSFKEAVMGTIDELKEFVEEPSMDELSDIVYCLNRFAGSLTNRPYLKVVPGDGLHIAKVNKRMQDYGCIRSKRHLKNGQCPSK